MDLKKKQISVGIILTSFLLLVFSFLAKTSRYIKALGYEEKLQVDFIIFQVDYLKAIFFLLGMLGLGIFLFLFKNDTEIRSIAKMSILKKYVKKLFVISKKIKNGIIKAFARDNIDDRRILLALMIVVLGVTIYSYFGKRFFMYKTHDPLSGWTKAYQYYHNYANRNIEIPLSEYEVSFYFFRTDFYITFFLMLVLSVLSVWIFSKKNDQQVKRWLFRFIKLPQKSRLDRTELISLGAILFGIILSWLFYNDVFLAYQALESIITLPIYEKIIEGASGELSTVELVLFEAQMRLDATKELYGNNEIPNFFFGLTILAAFILFARHLQKNKENRRMAVLIFSGVVIFFSSLNWGIIEYADTKKMEAVEIFKNNA